ncbi:unnamed protein product [Rhizoctonia solani]|uniref:PIN domain-like protein n=1 Tax=Rhizoctonia solani TaxID=456999 RepID=A0A8H3CS98_9AGAM|nr:unnamed protein product [Rhizoctonia solani]
MGVMGIVPFLLKKCPVAIENIPNRFQALEGKTIAIDGTLITQRLFFAPDPRPHRHVLGWYQLIQELRQNKINVICVFDGKGRIPAKHDEVQRRRLLRAQAEVRGVWEKSRYERLLSLTQTLRGLESLSTEHQQEILKTLQVDPHPLHPKERPPDVPGLVDLSRRQEDTNDHLGQEPRIGTSTSTSKSSLEAINLAEHDPANVIVPGSLLNEMLSTAGRPSVNEQAAENAHARAPRLPDNDRQAGASLLEETVGEDIAQTAPPAETPLFGETRRAEDTEEDGTRESDVQHTVAKSSKGVPVDQSPTYSDAPAAEPAMGDTGELGNVTQDKLTPSWTEVKLRVDYLENEDTKAITHKILDLFEHYNRTTTTGPDGTIPASGTLAGVQDAPIIPISRVQLKYTQEEAKLWNQLVTPSDDSSVDLARVVDVVEQLTTLELPQDEVSSDEVTPEEMESPISERSAKLEEQSGLMAASLVRRANPPTALNYAESRLILEAMGIPCLESYLPYEAEALACSLVLNGLADFVGSEDTDVLMYNAPLLRNMTNRKVPLQLIPPSVETNLGLSRAAFVDAAILMGTDFVRRLGGIGPTTAWRLMDKYGSIEVMLEQEPKFRPSDITEYLEQVKVARIIFDTIPPVPAVEHTTPGDWDEQAVYDVMSRFGLESYLHESQVIPGAMTADYYNNDSESKPFQ